MAKTELMKSTLPNMYSQALAKKNMGFAANFTHIIGWSIVSSVGDALRAIKSKEKPAAFAFYNGTNELLIAAKVFHDPSTDAEHPEGSWQYLWTFDPEDIKDCVIMDLNNVDNHFYIIKRAFDKYSMEFINNMLVPMVNTFFEVLKEWLTENAKEGENVFLEQPSVFLAGVVKDDKGIAFSFEPIGKMTQLIKDDADLEV